MITFSKEEINKSVKEVQQYYQNNIQGTIVKHSVLGDIQFSAKGFKETRHFIAPYYMPILLKIKEIIKTGNTNGILAPITKNRIDKAIGFYYIHNKILYGEQELNLTINIKEDELGHKYYMFHFTKMQESHILDRGLSTEVNISDGSYMANYSIIEDEEKVKSLEPKIGDIFWLGDTIKIEVVDIIEQDNTKSMFKSLTEKLEKLNKEI